MLSEYLQQPFDPEHRTLDKVLEDAIKEKKKKQEHDKQVKEIRRIWNE